MSTLDQSEQHDLRTTIEGYFGKQTPADWEMNSVVIEFVRQMRAAEQSCSTAFAECRNHLTPKDVVEEVTG